MKPSTVHELIITAALIVSTAFSFWHEYGQAQLFMLWAIFLLLRTDRRRQP